MNDKNKGGPSPIGGKPGGERQRGPGGGDKRGPAPGGGGRRDDRRPGGGPGGPRKGGRGGPGGSAAPARAETYESITEVTRGAGFKIDKRVVAEKGQHKPIKTEYRLTREGLKLPLYFPRLADAQAAAIAPLPEPEPEPEIVEPELTEASSEETAQTETHAPESDSAERVVDSEPQAPPAEASPESETAA